MSHNIESTTSLKLTLGGGYVVHIFNIALTAGSQPALDPRALPFAIRAYIVDENKADSEMVSLDLEPLGMNKTADSIRLLATHVITYGVKRERGLNSLLDAIDNLED
jgi:hypothetical protein